MARGEWRTMEDIPRLRHPLPSHLSPSRSHASNLLDLLLHLIVFKWLLFKSISTRWVRVDGLTEDERKPMLKIFHALLPSQTISRPCQADYAALAANARQSLASHDNLTHICPPRPARPTTAQDFLFSTSRGEHYPVSTTPGITIASTRPELPGN